MPDDHSTTAERLQPFDAFAELARIVLAEHSLESVMARIADITQRTVPGADEVSVTVVERGDAKTVAQTGPLALSLDERQYERGYGPCLDSIDGGEPVHIDSMRSDDRWPSWTVRAVEEGAESSLSIPVPLQREVDAALNIYSRTERGLDDRSVQLARTFAAHAGVALANIHLYESQSRVAEQLQHAMHARAVIEQAKGIIMGDRRCSAEEAFNLLVSISQDTNRKLRDVARALVDQAERPPAEGAPG
jgi:GAF domain-containing protein